MHPFQLASLIRFHMFGPKLRQIFGPKFYIELTTRRSHELPLSSQKEHNFCRVHSILSE